jgi:DNA-binding phage protein
MATTGFDLAEYLEDPEAQASFLCQMLEDGSADEVRAAMAHLII